MAKYILKMPTYGVVLATLKVLTVTMALTPNYQPERKEIYWFTTVPHGFHLLRVLKVRC